jgi:hypothetical protein
MTNNLRDENGGLVGGLEVSEYNAGFTDFEERRPPPKLTTASYDLGRQRSAEKAENKHNFVTWLTREEERRNEALKALLPPKPYAALMQQISTIRGEKKPPR